MFFEHFIPGNAQGNAPKIVYRSKKASKYCKSRLRFAMMTSQNRPVSRSRRTGTNSGGITASRNGTPRAVGRRNLAVFLRFWGGSWPQGSPRYSRKVEMFPFFGNIVWFLLEFFGNTLLRTGGRRNPIACVFRKFTVRLGAKMEKKQQYCQKFSIQVLTTCHRKAILNGEKTEIFPKILHLQEAC